MTFPASNIALRRAYDTLKERAVDIDNNTTALRAACVAGNVGADRIIYYAQSLARAKTEMATLAATPGLAAYAQAQENNPSLDIAAEYNAMMAQINSTIAWVAANIPKDGSGYLLVVQIAADGSLTWRQFAPAALTGLVTVLDALAATIS